MNSDMGKHVKEFSDENPCWSGTFYHFLYQGI